jgi:cobalamin synthase
MRRLFAGIAFLSRIPVPGAATFDAADVGRATLLFPLVGVLLGGLLVLALTVGVLGWRGGVILGGVTAVSALQGAWCAKDWGDYRRHDGSEHGSM